MSNKNNKNHTKRVFRILMLAAAFVMECCYVGYGAVEGAELAAYAGKEAARLSHLPLLGDVETYIVDNREELLEVLWADYREDFPEGRMEALQFVSEKIGFYVGDIESDEEIIQSQSEGIAGFYNHKNKLVYIIDPVLQEELQDLRDERMEGQCGSIRESYVNPVSEDWYKKNSNKIVLVHEMTHVVEDQHFDLTAWMDQYEANTDVIIGIKTVVEGLAEYNESNYIRNAYFHWYRRYERYFKDYYGMLLYVRELERAGNIEYGDESCGEFVSYTYQMTTFPYRYGAGLIDRVKEEKGWGKVHDLFYNHPMSTEQILHPEKFLDEKKLDFPTFIEAPDVSHILPEEYEFLDTDSMGEFRIYLLLKDLMFLAPQAMSISEGWDGDRYMAFYDKAHEDVVFAWNTIWDSKEEAQEFINAYRVVAGRKAIGERTLKSDSDTLVVETSYDMIYAKLQGNQVVVVEGLEDIETIEKLATALFAAETYEATYDDWEVVPEWYVADEEEEQVD